MRPRPLRQYPRCTTSEAQRSLRYGASRCASSFELADGRDSSAALHRAGTAVLLQEVVSLDSLIAIYIAWIVAQTGLSAPDHPPIHFVTPAEMAMRHGSPENSGLELQALYNRNEGSIYLPQEWRPDDLRRSLLRRQFAIFCVRSRSCGTQPGPRQDPKNKGERLIPSSEINPPCLCVTANALKLLPSSAA